MKVNFVRRFPSVEEGRRANEIYLERAPGQRYYTSYITMSDPEVYTSSIPESEIGRLIGAAINGASQVMFLDTYDQWADTIHPTTDCLILVKDYSADPAAPEGATGGMAYFFSPRTNRLIPSFRMPLDLYKKELDWSGFEHTPEQIAEAIEASHTHENKETVDLLGELILEGGRRVLLLDGKPVSNNVLIDPSW